MKPEAQSKDTEGPDVLHIGFSKCASTFLQAYFDDHPGVFLVNQSHYFAPFEYSPYPEGVDKYRLMFKAAAKGQVRLESDEHIVLPLFHPVLEAAATTLDSSREVARRIASVQPSARILILIRNQLDLLVSRYSEYVICGGVRNFDDFVGEFLRCTTDGVNYFQNYYAQILRIFQESFSAANVLMLLQEDLARSERETVSALSSFLGIEARSPERRGMLSRRVGLSEAGIRAMRSFNRKVVIKPKRSFHEAEVRLPYLLYKVLQRGIRVADYYSPAKLKGDKRSIVTDAVRQRLALEFRADNRELGSMLGKDLAALGYAS